MKKKILENKNIIYPLIMLIVLCMIVLMKAQFVMESDDGFYSVVLKNGDFSILKLNNRVLVNIIVIIVETMGVWFWRCCNLIVIILMYIYILKIIKALTGENESLIINTIICGLFFLIPINVLSSGLFWITGSFNYAWGVVGCLMFLYPFISEGMGNRCGKVEYLVGIIGGIYGGNIEQTSAVQVCFSTIILIYMIVRKEKIQKKYFALYLVGVISLIVLLIIPFNSDRTIAAVQVYYPDFYMLTFWDKVYQGCVNLYSHVLEKNSIIMLTLSGVICFQICKEKYSKFIQLISCLPVVYFLVNIFNKASIFNGETIKVLYEIDIYKYENLKSKMLLTPFFVITFIILIELYLITKIMESLFGKLCVFLTYCAGYASALIMSFSPTIFASGKRVFFLLDIFLILLIGMVLYKAKDENREKEFEQIVPLIVFACSLVICIKMSNLLSGVIYY